MTNANILLAGVNDLVFLLVIVLHSVMFVNHTIGCGRYVAKVDDSLRLEGLLRI